MEMKHSVLICAVLSTALLSVLGTQSAEAAIINVPADHATIQVAIDAAASGDTIIVAAGTYSENLTLNKSLTLQGEQAGVNACGRVGSETTVDGVGTIRLELLTGSAGSIIDGFNLTGGANTIESNTGGIADLQILNNKINGFTSSGIFLDDSGTNITVGGNEVDADAKSGGGASVHLDTDDFDGFWLTDNCIVYTGPNTFATGTGFFVDGAHNVGASAARNPKITGNLITRHVTGMNLGSRAFAANTLGTIASPGASDQGTISNNTFSFNQFDGLQGGIQRTLIDGNKFNNNGRSGLALTSFGDTRADRQDRGAQGTTITNNCFTNNGQGSSSLGIPLHNAGILYSSSQVSCVLSPPSGLLPSTCAAVDPTVGSISTNVAHDNSFSGNYRGAIYGNTCSSNGGACSVAADCAQICSGGSNSGAACTGVADCPGGSCPVPTCSTSTGGAQTINAENNYWGAPSGPAPGGSGDQVDTPNSSGGSIDFIPFSTSTTLSCLSCTPANCDDDNPCTDDSCDPIDGCVNAPNSAACDDGNACTSGDICQGGICAGTSTISSSNLNGWSGISRRTAAGSFVVGPSVPPLGTGSYEMATGPGGSGPPLPGGDSAGLGGKTWMGTEQFNGTLLSAITAFGYSTYIQASPGGNTITVAINMYVDLDGNGTRDTTLVFEPYYSTVASGGTQPNLAVGAWQTWDAIQGGAAKWWYTASFGALTNPFNDFQPLSYYVGLFPNAKIVTWYSPGDPIRSDGWGMNLVAGQNSPGAPWNDFTGNIDNFTFATASGYTGNFEPLNPCDDDNPCTDDSCDPIDGCVYANNTAPCDDGDACTLGDICRDGACVCDTPPGSYTTQVDVYLASGLLDDTRFDFSSAYNGIPVPPATACSHRRDVVFNCGYYTDALGAGPGFVCSAGFNSGRANSFPKDPGHLPAAIPTAGWYTFRHTFKAAGDALVIDMAILPLGSSTPTASWTLYPSTDPGAAGGAIILSPSQTVVSPLSPTDFVAGPNKNVGGNRYGWFVNNELPVLAFDDSSNTATGFNQGFEVDVIGWDVFGGTFNATRVASGTNGITSAMGSFHAESVTSATRWGSYQCAFPASACPGPDCDDLDPCTVDSCDPIDGCVHTSICGACCDRSQPGGFCVSDVPQSQCLGSSGTAVFTDPVAFEAFNAAEGKFKKGLEDFEESTVGPGEKIAFPDPLEGNVPNTEFPNGLTQKNLIIQTNFTPGPSPAAPNPSGSPVALFVIGPGFIGSNSKKVGEDLEVLTGQDTSLDLIFTEPNHTGVGFELSHFQGFGGGDWTITVYDKADDIIGVFLVPTAEEPAKNFFGVWTPQTIGRINIYDADIAPDAVDDIWMWVGPPSQVQWYEGEDCAEDGGTIDCLEHTGACCDRRIADPLLRCRDGVPESLCVIDDPTQVSWTKETLCADLDPSCSEHTGACCDRRIADPLLRCRDDVPQSLCVIDDPTQVSWTKGALCADLDPSCSEHTGACCDRRISDPVLRCRDAVPESLCVIDDPTQVSWTKGTLCADLDPACSEHTGACCDRRIADPLLRCRDDVTESLCVIDDPTQVSWTKGTLCADLDPSCSEHTGACCDRRIADPLLRCRDDVPESLCVIDDPAQMTWTKGTSCRDLDPGCTEHTGACCDQRIADADDRCRDDLPASECVIDDPDQVSWYKGVRCADLDPACLEHTGACCDEDSFGTCQDNLPASQCNCTKCVFYKDTPCAEIVCLHKAIPTMSQWGLAVLTLLLLIGAKVYFGRRPRTQSVA